MGAAGYPPSLSEVRDTAEAGLFAAFTQGFRSVCHALLLMAAPVFIVVTGWSISNARRRSIQLRKRLDSAVE
jgi:hypothetical protein